MEDEHTGAGIDPTTALLVFTCAAVAAGIVAQWLIAPGPAWGPLERLGMVIGAAPWVLRGLRHLADRLR